MSVFLSIAATLFSIPVVYIILPHVFRLWKTARLENTCKSGGIVSLTYDDGPGLELTGRLLDLLKREDIRATFFVLGHRAIQSKETVRNYLADGHDVGSHTYDHLHGWKALPGKCASDIAAGRDVVDELGGDGCLFRPTYGKLNIWTLFHVLRHKYRLAWWTIDSADSQETPRTVSRVLKEIDDNNGGVVLMHDYDDYKTGDHVDYVLTMTKAVISHARARNMKILPLSEILDRPSPASS